MPIRSIPTETVRYFNREVSWLQFNQRVLSEAENLTNPLLERLKFLAIFESNLDEFYMVRVSGLIEQYEGGVTEKSPDGLTPGEQLIAIAGDAFPLRERAGAIWRDELLPALAEAGVVLRDYSQLTADQVAELQELFRREIMPICTPLILHPAPSVPFISNRSLNLAIEIEDEGGTQLGRVKIPLPDNRLIKLKGKKSEFVLVDDVIKANIAELYPGANIVGVHPFRVLRDADIEIRELEAADLVTTIEKTISMRRFGDPVLLEINPEMPLPVRKVLMHLLILEDDDVFVVNGLLGFSFLWELAGLSKPDLKFPTHLPYQAEPLSNGSSLLENVAKGDILVHHPFDSFGTMQNFADAASTDPSVIGIKMTLYRVGSESPIVETLLDAAGEQKQVAVLVELKARFDESNNLVWARALERAGVHVSYGFAELKTHCKLCLLVRRESAGVKLYAHIGTGNYNPSTARLYTDLGLFTCDPEITQDIVLLFNYLTGYSKNVEYKKLLVAPQNLREGILDRIGSEIALAKSGRKGHIIFKLNSLVDPEVIDELYEASQAGVKVDLLVRGICCLRPGVEGLSENIQVRSLVGRFLEHTRIYYFANGDDPIAYIGSADLMRRNLDRRVETLVPVQNPEHLRLIRDEIFEPYLRDNTNSWQLQTDGSYERVVAGPSEKFSAQDYLIQHPISRFAFPKQS
ncbi:MAG: polyphosphate kinase 1 [Armatimonadetes bacterium]|nr:polyphosphate kinase 1 [Armatimonadota bacterium]